LWPYERAEKSVFKEFHQLNNPERDRRKGLELGLTIVEKIAKLMGHKLSLRLKIHAGSSFGITVARGNPVEVSQPQLALQPENYSRIN